MYIDSSSVFDLFQHSLHRLLTTSIGEWLLTAAPGATALCMETRMVKVWRINSHLGDLHHRNVELRGLRGRLWDEWWPHAVQRRQRCQLQTGRQSTLWTYTYFIITDIFNRKEAARCSMTATVTSLGVMTPPRRHTTPPSSGGGSLTPASTRPMSTPPWPVTTWWHDDNKQCFYIEKSLLTLSCILLRHYKRRY